MAETTWPGKLQFLYNIINYLLYNKSLCVIWPWTSIFNHIRELVIIFLGVMMIHGYNRYACPPERQAQILRGEVPQ